MGNGGESHRSQKSLERETHRSVVVDHMNGLFSRHRALCQGEPLGA